jgi:hypothetical protein
MGWLFFLVLLVAPASLLDLDTVPLGAGLPAGWTVRPVKGQTPPDYQIVESTDGSRILRISGHGAAAWATHELAHPIEPASGRLRWSWRVLVTPDSADLRRRDRDDSALRLFVVFGKPGGLFNSSGRIIFYSWGNTEPEGLTLRSHVSGRIQIVRLAGQTDTGQAWQVEEVDPFADCRGIWDREPPPITAVGLMQDTDMTRSPAVAEFRGLLWEPQP